MNPRHAAVVDEYVRDLAWAYAAAPDRDPTRKRVTAYGVSSGVLPSANLREDLVRDLGRRYDVPLAGDRS